nr:unnamed protein product [Callosobruchus analis]
MIQLLHMVITTSYQML